MKIAIDPHVPGVPNLQCRKMRRLVYLAWIARDLGHDVAIRSDPNEFQTLRKRPAYNGRSGFSFVDLLNDFPTVSDLRRFDLLICSEEAATHRRRPACAVAAWRSRIGGGAKIIAKRDRFDLLCGYILSQSDWTRKKTTGGKARHDAPSDNPLGDKWFSVPWLPFECTLHMMHEDGMWKAYLQDDLEAIRGRYGATEKQRFGGFVGFPWGWRTKIERAIDDPRFVFLWPDCAEHKSAMKPRAYLRWLSECCLSLNLPGDTWKCSRFGESAMMGVPIVHPRNVVDLTPPLTDNNAVLIDDWMELRTMVQSATELRSVTAKADKAYREGWSLRGQFQQMLKRLGVCV